MKWLFLLIFCSALTTSFAREQDSTRSFSLISYLSKGETLNYAVVKTRTDSSQAKEPKITTNKFSFKIVVVDSTDSSYRFEYYRTADLFGSEQFSNLPHETLNKIMALSQLKIEYETDEFGAFKQILNEEQLKDKIETDFEELKSLSASSNEQFEEFIDDLMATANPESLISLYCQDIFALHFAMGFTVDLQDTISYEDEILVPILNIPVKAYGIFYCDEYDEENDYISFMEEKVIEKDYMEKMLEFFKKFENKDNPIPIDELRNLDMDIYMCNNYQYNSLYGVPIVVELYKEITVNSAAEKLKRTEVYTITLEE